MSRRRAGVLVMALGLAAALVGTLWPFDFDTSPRAVGAKWDAAEWQLYYTGDHGELTLDPDFAANLLLLAPIGIGWALARSRRSVARIAAEAALVGVGAATLLEALQLLTPDRVTQLADLWRNGLGCVAAAAVTSSLDRRWVGRHAQKVS